MTKALEKTDSGELTAKVNNLFATKTPAKFIKTRPGRGGKPVKYIEIGYIVNKLNEAFKVFWEFQVKDKQIGKKQVWVLGTLTIKDPKTGFSITKENFGGVDIKFNKDTGGAVDIADDLKAAVADSLKKCASMFGIAADIFYKEQEQYEQMGTNVSVTAGEEASRKRISMNRYFAVANEVGIDKEQAKRMAKMSFGAEHMEDLTDHQLTVATASLKTSNHKEPDGRMPLTEEEIEAGFDEVDRTINGF